LVFGIYHFFGSLHGEILVWPFRAFHLIREKLVFGGSELDYSEFSLQRRYLNDAPIRGLKKSPFGAIMNICQK